MVVRSILRMTTLLSLSQLLLIGLSLFARQSQGAEYNVGDSNQGIVYAGGMCGMGLFVESTATDRCKKRYVKMVFITASLAL